MAVPITLTYGGALALWFLVLSIRVIQGRTGAAAPSLGDGGNLMMQRRIRGHANFAEYVPLVLVLMGFLEVSGQAPWVLHGIGLSLLVGRLAHGITFAFTKESVVGRSLGILLTLLSLLAAAGLSLACGLSQL